MVSTLTCVSAAAVDLLKTASVRMSDVLNAIYYEKVGNHTSAVVEYFVRMTAVLVGNCSNGGNLEG